MINKKQQPKLVPGQTIDIYLDWQEEKIVEGVARLIEKQRDEPTFYYHYKTYYGERWLVHFIGTTFITHRIVRRDVT